MHICCHSPLHVPSFLCVFFCQNNVQFIINIFIFKFYLHHLFLNWLGCTFVARFSAFVHMKFNYLLIHLFIRLIFFSSFAFIFIVWDIWLKRNGQTFSTFISNGQVSMSKLFLLFFSLDFAILCMQHMYKISFKWWSQDEWVNGLIFRIHLDSLIVHLLVFLSQKGNRLFLQLLCFIPWNGRLYLHYANVL